MQPHERSFQSAAMIPVSLPFPELDIRAIAVIIFFVMIALLFQVSPLNGKKSYGTKEALRPVGPATSIVVALSSCLPWAFR
jgi:hypothetical protein